MTSFQKHDANGFLVYKIRLLPSGIEFESPPDATILMAALGAAVRLPSACRNGVCRTCLCRLKTGSVRYQIEWPGLTREEHIEGLILPCVAIAESDLLLEVDVAVSMQ